MQEKSVKSAIAEVFSELIKKKNIDKITVKDIADGCGITRQGFYYHFRDILALVEWMLKDTFEKSLKKSLKKEEPVKIMEEIINITIKNKDMITGLLNYKDREAIERIMVKTMRDFVQARVDERITASPESDVITDFYSFGISGAIMGICGRENADIRESARVLIKIINEGVGE